MALVVEECRVRLTPGDDVQAALSGGGVVCFSAGVYPGAFTLGANVTLRGDPGAVLDAAGKGSVLQVSDDDLQIRVEGITLRNGHNDAGGGLFLHGWSDVTVDRCVVEGARASQAGGAVYVSAGRLTVTGSEFRGNAGRFGQDLIATGASDVTIATSSFSSDIAAREGAVVSLTNSTVAGTVDVRGTTTRGPTVTIAGGSVPRVRNDAAVPGTVIQR